MRNLIKIKQGFAVVVTALYFINATNLLRKYIKNSNRYQTIIEYTYLSLQGIRNCITEYESTK